MTSVDDIISVFECTDLKVVAKAYRESMYDTTEYDGYAFSLGYQWQDKKHRHVNQLCKRLEDAADEIARLNAEIAELKARLETTT